MAIQRINLGTAPTGTGGDTNRSAFKKIDDNFGDSTNACSRLVGNNNGQIPTIDTNFGLGGAGYLGTSKTIASVNLDDLSSNPITGYTGMPTGFYYIRPDVTTTSSDIKSAFCMHVAYGTGNTKGFRLFNKPYQDVYFLQSSNSSSETWSAPVEIYHKKSVTIYNTTTAASPNVFVTSSGELQRSTSSERYKKDIEHIVLSEQQYQAIRQVKPIMYKSTTGFDNPNWTFQSFSAEELAAASPTLVLWEYEETVTDENTGELITRKLPERRPAGLNLNGIVALQQAFSLKQADLIDKLIKQNKALSDRVTALEKKVG